MKLLNRWCAVVVMMMWAVAAAAQQPAPQGEFIPIDQLPVQDQMPAAPLLVSAYAFVMIVLFLYLFMVARRLSNVQREIDRLNTTIKQGGRA
jgi:CcmD family protein